VYNLDRDQEVVMDEHKLSAWISVILLDVERGDHLIPFGSRNTSNLLALFRPGFFKKWFRSYGYATIF